MYGPWTISYKTTTSGKWIHVHNLTRDAMVVVSNDLTAPTVVCSRPADHGGYFRYSDYHCPAALVA